MYNHSNLKDAGISSEWIPKNSKYGTECFSDGLPGYDPTAGVPWIDPNMVTFLLS
jgi:hypothetical protein